MSVFGPIWKVKAKEHYWGREHWEKVMLEPIKGKLLEYKRGEYVIFEAPRDLIEDYIRRRILFDYEILEEHSSESPTMVGERRGLIERLKTRRTIILREPLFARWERKFKTSPVETEGSAKKYHVRYIDLTTGRTQEKELSELELHDFYKAQREGKVSVIEIHRVRESSSQVTRLAVDRELETKREAKKREWLGRGYSPFLVDKALLLADDWIASLAEAWAPGRPDIQKFITTANYEKALDVADRWLKAMTA